MRQLDGALDNPVNASDPLARARTGAPRRKKRRSSRRSFPNGSRPVHLRGPVGDTTTNPTGVPPSSHLHDIHNKYSHDFTRIFSIPAQFIRQ